MAVDDGSVIDANTNYLYHPRPYQADALNSIEDLYWNHHINRQLVFWATGLGKGVQYSAPVLTPEGWSTHGEIEVGDTVYDQDGAPTKVIGKYPQPPLAMYRVHFNDNTHMDVCGPHEWKVRTKSMAHRAREGKSTGRWKVFETQELASQPNRKWQLPNVDPVEHPEKDLPLDPYVYGILLAEGSITDRVQFATGDSDVVELVQYRLLNTPFEVRSVGTDEVTYSIVNEMTKLCDEVGLRWRRSWEKSIDKRYLFGSTQQRIDLLRGLMDGDGTVSEEAVGHFSSASKDLAEGVRDLVRSFGGRTRVRRNKASLNGERMRDRYRVRVNIPVNPFNLRRKAERYNTDTRQGRSLIITEVEELGYKEETVCLEVDSPHSTYVTENYKVTHNSSGCMMHLPIRFPHHVLDHGFLFLAHRRKILKQAYTKFVKAYPNLSVGLDMGEHEAIGYEDAVFASVESLGREYQTRIEKYRDRHFGVVVADEGHHVKEDSTWDRILNFFGVGSDEDQHYTINVQGEQVPPLSMFLTATPTRNDDHTLAPFLDEVASEMSIVDGISHGWLTDIKAHRAWTEADLDELTDQGEIDFLVQTTRKFLRGHRTLVFARSVDQSERLTHNVNEHGIVSAAHIDAETPPEERKDIYDDFEDGGVDMLSNRLVLTEGYDNPAITAIMDNAPTESKPLHIQKIGRGLRPHPDANVDAYDTAEDRKTAIRRSPKPHLLYISTFDPTKHGLDVVAELTEDVDVNPEGEMLVEEVVDVVEEFEEEMPEFDVSDFDSVRDIEVTLQKANVLTQTVYNDELKAITPLNWVVERDKAALYLKQNPFADGQYRSAPAIIEFERTGDGRFMKRIIGGGWNGSKPLKNRYVEQEVVAEDLHDCIEKQDGWLKENDDGLYYWAVRESSEPATEQMRDYLRRKNVPFNENLTRETARILIDREKIKQKREDI